MTSHVRQKLPLLCSTPCTSPALIHWRRRWCTSTQYGSIHGCMKSERQHVCPHPRICIFAGTTMCVIGLSLFNVAASNAVVDPPEAAIFFSAASAAALALSLSRAVCRIIVGGTDLANVSVNGGSLSTMGSGLASMAADMFEAKVPCFLPSASAFFWARSMADLPYSPLLLNAFPETEMRFFLVCRYFSGSRPQQSRGHMRKSTCDRH
mmetsp:Transcript_116832/g.283398  ORF Transcript_116832/g.283398 Transcript_116832/m.283398 type:complete len:208 (-) Transcript_116832:18-641(-)